MKLPEPVSRTFTGLISDIEKGQIKIPQFQRDFVWDIKKSAKLLDSILKGYPIGTFIFWKTKDRLRSVRKAPARICTKRICIVYYKCLSEVLPLNGFVRTRTLADSKRPFFNKKFLNIRFLYHEPRLRVQQILLPFT